jgi:hypothetical protein
MIITYNGPTPPKKSSIKVPSWGGGETKDTFQPWHSEPFSVASNNGIELYYPHEDCTVSSGNCPLPFVKLSEMYYQLDLDTVLSVPQGKLLVMPHYRFYTSTSWDVPLPVASAWEASWWPLPLSILFRFGQEPASFKKGEPFAQAILIEKHDFVISKSTSKVAAAKYIEDSKDKYITRKWTMANGVTQDNIYNVLANLEKLPQELSAKSKRLKMVRRTNDSLVQD